MKKLTLAGLGLAVILSSTSLSSAEEMNNMQDKQTTMKQGMMMDGNMMENCKEMMAGKKMMEEMKAQDAQLTEQVARMNSAPADQKTTLMAEVITRMVEQRTAMNQQKEKMHEKMMEHMSQHKQMGKESMAQCPMMKGMKDTE